RAVHDRSVHLVLAFTRKHRTLACIEVRIFLKDVKRRLHGIECSTSLIQHRCTRMNSLVQPSPVRLVSLRPKLRLLDHTGAAMHHDCPVMPTLLLSASSCARRPQQRDTYKRHRLLNHLHLNLITKSRPCFAISSYSPHLIPLKEKRARRHLPPRPLLLPRARRRTCPIVAADAAHIAHCSWWSLRRRLPKELSTRMVRCTRRTVIPPPQPPWDMPPSFLSVRVVSQMLYS